MKFDLSRLEELVDLMESHDLGELEVQDDQGSVALERLAPSGRIAPKSEPMTTHVTVTATRVGIYAGKTAVGARVKEGDILGEIRVMDVKYGIPAPVSGVIEELFVEDAVAVEYGQPLMRIEPVRG